MADTKDDKDQKQRSLDPTRSGEDFVGDTTGTTGITTGSAEQTSASPDDKPKDQDKDHLPGGIDTSYETNPTGTVPRESYDQKQYKKELGQNESGVYANRVNDIASEKQGAQINEPSNVDLRNTPSDMDEETALGIDIKDSNNVGENSPSELGEQSVSGTTPDPSSDDDTLENAHIMGEQTNEDLEHPKEIDIARDVDKAEEDLRSH